MGGYVPLGYDVKDRKLVVNEEEAATVRGIFERFVDVGSATVLARELRRKGLRNKQGTLVDKGYLYRVLVNRVYRGDAVHKGKAYPGEHQPSSTSNCGISPCHLAAEPAKARQQHARAGACVAQGPDLHGNGRRHDAEQHEEGRAAIPVLRLDGRHQES